MLSRGVSGSFDQQQEVLEQKLRAAGVAPQEKQDAPPEEQPQQQPATSQPKPQTVPKFGQRPK